MTNPDPFGVDDALERFQGYTDDLLTLADTLRGVSEQLMSQERDDLRLAMKGLGQAVTEVRESLRPSHLDYLALNYHGPFDEVVIGEETVPLHGVGKPRKFVIANMVAGNMADDGPRTFESSLVGELFVEHGVASTSARPTVSQFLRDLKIARPSEAEPDKPTQPLTPISGYYHVWAPKTGRRGLAPYNWWVGPDADLPTEYIGYSESEPDRIIL